MNNTKYTFVNIIIIITILTFAYIYCIIYAPLIENSNDDSFTTQIANMNKSCLLQCKSESCKNYISNNRGNQYFISIPISEQEEIKSCVITFWGFTHFLMYFVLALIVPAFYIELFFIGVMFEIYEYYKYDCHDLNDIYLNVFGILLGKFMSPFNY
jgi:hypothetical protein